MVIIVDLDADIADLRAGWHGEHDLTGHVRVDRGGLDIRDALSGKRIPLYVKRAIRFEAAQRNRSGRAADVVDVVDHVPPDVVFILNP